MEAVQEELEVKVADKEIHEPPIISDPWELMAQFYESPRYKDMFAKFYKDKDLSPDVTEKEKEKVFLEDHKARAALVDFATQDILFKYNPTSFPQRSREALSEYIKVEKDRQKMYEGKVSGDEALALDEYRYKYHQEAARALARDGIAPTKTIGEALARLVLIDKELDTPESAKESTSGKLRRKLGV